jgi:hypothetical protein
MPYIYSPFDDPFTAAVPSSRSVARPQQERLPVASTMRVRSSGRSQIPAAVMSHFDSLFFLTSNESAITQPPDLS